MTLSEKLKVFARWRKANESLLFGTHTPEAFQPGTVRDGFVVTRLVEVVPTRLLNGGIAPHFEVYGRPQ